MDGRDGALQPLEDRSSPLNQAQNGGDGAVTPRVAIEQPPLATLLRTKSVKERRPPDDLVASLISLFFLYIHPWIPFLDAQEVFVEMGRAMDGEPPLLCHALFSIALPFSLDSRLTQPLCDSFWKYVKRRILVEVLEEPSYASLEALAVLVLDLSGMTNGPQVWGSLAIAVKLAVQLKTLDGRFLRPLPAAEDGEGGEGGSSPLQAAQLDRRRLFWAIYALDCYVSITTSHPSELADYHIAHFLPTRDATWPAYGGDIGTATPIAVFGYHLKLMGISRALHTTYLEYAALSGENESQVTHWLREVADCSGALAEWFRGIPASMQYEYGNSSEGPQVGSRRYAPPPVTLVRAYYHSLVIYLHGLVAFPSVAGIGSHPGAYQSASRESCASSVDSLASIASAVTKDGVGKLGWPFAWSLWVGARHILIARHNGFAFPPERFDALLRCLGRSARYWQIGGKYWRLLRQADDEQRGGIVYGGGGSGGGVLAFLLDQRVATSDLEDRFRIDSFFKEAADSSEPMLMSGGGSHLGGLPVTLERGGLDDLLSPELLGQPSEAWFSGLLSASSAYQQTYPGYFDYERG